MTAAKYEAGKYYLDKKGNLCFVTKRVDQSPGASKGWLEVSMYSRGIDHWDVPLHHKLDGVFENSSYYSLYPGEIILSAVGARPHPLDTMSAAYSPDGQGATSAEPEKSDPSIDRDRRHLPEAIEGRHLRDHFPDLKNWAVTSGTQAQPKQAVHPLQKWS